MTTMTALGAGEPRPYDIARNDRGDRGDCNDCGDRIVAMTTPNALPLIVCHCYNDGDIQRRMI
jgi:hypothetical protein